MNEDETNTPVDVEPVYTVEIDGCERKQLSAGLVFGVIGLSVGAYQSVQRYAAEIRLRAQRKKNEKLSAINMQKEFELAVLKKENEEHDQNK